MYRARTRACPACGSPMGDVWVEVSGRSDPVEIDVCDGCGCAYFEYFDGEPVGIAKGLAESGHTRKLARLDRVPVCPDCEDEMQAQPYLGDGPHLFRCGACAGVCATPMQLDALREYRMRREVRDQPIVAFLYRLAELDDFVRERLRRLIDYPKD